ncbi:hypothetical protein JCM8547_000958 [Rhodosporidiobolus lusitaniae]
MFSTLARGYNAVSQAARESAAPQSATGTIDKLCDRLLNAERIEERKAALLGLKGLSRDWKSDVGTRALPILLGVLEEDAQEDVEMAKAVVETMSLLCEVEEVDGRPVRDDSGLRNTDVFLATPTPLHTLLTLLTPAHFYLRFFSLQLLGILLANRPAQVQQYVLTAAGGVGRLVETLDDSREIIRNESLLLIIALTTQNADIQKLLAFEGAFDKLFGIVRSEGGIGSGGIVVQDCLAAVGGLLRWNVSNQNYFRETSCIPLFAPLLLFPRPNALTPQSLSTFAFQSWSEQKVINAGLVISLVRMLVGGAGSGRSGNQKALLQTGLTRCLIELALASNAPAVLKSQSLNALADILRLSPDNQSLLTSLIVTPLIPPAVPSSPETYMSDPSDPHAPPPGANPNDPHDPHAQGGDEFQQERPNKWRRGEPVPAVVAVVSLAVNGDGTPGREGLRVRAAAASLFENYVAGANDTQLGILSTMATPPPEAFDGDNTGRTESAGGILLRALRTFPTATRNDPFDSYVPFFACLLFSHLLLHSETSKTLARRIYFQGDDSFPGGEGDEDDRSTLVSILVGNMMMAQREQAQSQNQGFGPERALEWSRVMIGYLTVLSVWLWESPKTVKEFLSEGSNLQVLIQPITQSTGVDAVVQGLCAFLLGICYEYNREPGPITRETLHPILQSRVGPDQFVSRILRLREDPRFRNVGPQVLELIDEDDASADDLGEEDGLWFDFAFVEFLKTNYISVQRSILVDPHATTSVTRSVATPGSSEVLQAMRDTISEQAKELDELRELVHQLQQDRDEERNAYQHEVASLSDTLMTMRQTIQTLQTEKEEADREQEDLLVLLEDLSQKRREDKRKLRSKGVEVSEDEEEEDGDEGEGEDDGQEVVAQGGEIEGAEQVRQEKHGEPRSTPFDLDPEPEQQQEQHGQRSSVDGGSVKSERASSPPPFSQQQQQQPSANGSAAYDPFAPPPRRDEAFNPYAPSPKEAEKPFDPYAPPPKQEQQQQQGEPLDPYAPPKAEQKPFDPYAPPSKPDDKPFDPFAPPHERDDHDPYAPLSQKEQPHDPFAPPPSHDPFAPPPHDLFAPPPKREEAHDLYAPPPKAEKQEEQKLEEVTHTYDPFALLRSKREEEPESKAHAEKVEKELEEKQEEKEKEEKVEPEKPNENEEEKEQVKEEEPEQNSFAPPSYDPFSSSAPPRHDPFATVSAEQQPYDPFAPKAGQHDPFYTSSAPVPPPPKRNPAAATVQRHNAFNSTSSASSARSHDPSKSAPLRDPFGNASASASDVFASLSAQPSRAPSVQSNRTGTPAHDPFAPPAPAARSATPARDQFGNVRSAPAHDPFAPPPAKSNQQQGQQYDRIPSNPFGLSASQQQDDPYSPFGGPYQDNDPFGLNSSSHSSAQNDPYSPFNPPAAPSSTTSSSANHGQKASYGDVSSLF